MGHLSRYKHYWSLKKFESKEILYAYDMFFNHDSKIRDLIKSPIDIKGEKWNLCIESSMAGSYLVLDSPNSHNSLYYLVTPFWDGIHGIAVNEIIRDDIKWTCDWIYDLDSIPKNEKQMSNFIDKFINVYLVDIISTSWTEDMIDIVKDSFYEISDNFDVSMPKYWTREFEINIKNSIKFEKTISSDHMDFEKYKNQISNRLNLIESCQSFIKRVSHELENISFRITPSESGISIVLKIKEIVKH